MPSLLGSGLSASRTAAGRLFHIQLGKFVKVPMAHRLVTTCMTSRDCDVIIKTSQYSRSSHSDHTRTRINHPCRPFKHTIVEHCVKKSAKSA